MVLIDVESENGWRPPDLRPGDSLLVWKTIPGTNPPVNIQVMRGLPEVFLPAWVADWNAYVEGVTDDDTASYTDGNSVYTSNHKNGTAVDIDWKRHDYKVVGTVNPVQRTTITDMLDHYEGWIFWAGNWDDPVDEMHSQMGYNTWNRNTAALDFISRKIRSDGLSTFRRGPLSPTDPPKFDNAQPSAPPPDVAVVDTPTQVLYDAVPVIDMDRASELIDPVMAGLKLCNCKTINTIAMYLAEMGHESDGFATTEEYAKDGRYAPYIGRTWVQITWESNYAAFGEWCVEQGLLDDAEYFVNNPAKLADMQWAGIGPAWYCTVQEPQFMEFAEAGNVEDASKAINAPAWIGDTSKRANGIQDRIDRYNQAIALGSRLLLLVTADKPDVGGPLDALTPEEQHKLLDDVAEIRAQLSGDWPQNSNNAAAAADLDKRKAAGDRLTLNDLICWLKNHASTHAKPTP